MNARDRSPLPRVLLAVLITIVAAMPMLAFASPPDPTWTPGIYDDADYDDVVVLVTSATGDLSPVRAADLLPLFEEIGRVPPRPESALSALRVTTALPRAPPSA